MEKEKIHPDELSDYCVTVHSQYLDNGPIAIVDICSSIEEAKEVADKKALELNTIVSVFRKSLPTGIIDEVYVTGIPEKVN